jgi:glycosyltransferase involved in cell wall biosynthesis
MRILYFHQHFTTPKGSSGTRSYEFSKELIRAGHQVTLVCGSSDSAVTGLKKKFRSGYRTGIVDGINIIELELLYSNSQGFIKRSILFLKYSLYGVKISMRLNYDVVFGTSTPLTASIPGIVSKLLRSKRFIFEVRDLWPELPKAMGVITNPLILSAMDILETLSYKFADRCVALAPGIANGIKRKYPLKKVAIIPNGSDRFIAGKNYQKKSNKCIAAFTGAHGQANGLNAVLDVAYLLKQGGIADVEFHFIGDGKMKPSLIQRALNEDLDNCIFLDPMPKHKLFQYLHDQADIGLMVLENIPAFYNGTSPNKFFDYISLGLPVLNNYPGWLANMIESHHCGIAVPPGDPEAFAVAIIRIKNNLNENKIMSENGIKLARGKFDRALLASEFIDFILEHD